MSTKNVTTTPPDFTEQAQQLVESLNYARTHTRTYCCPEDAAFYDRQLIAAIASFAAEAATQGQIVGIERAAQVAEKYKVSGEGLLTTLIAQNQTAVSIVSDVRALSPDPAYHNRVTELERELAELKEINQGIIDGIPEGKALIESRHQVELDRVRNEAATAALEQERRRIENTLTKFGRGSLILYSNGAFELLAEGEAIRMDKKRCVAVGKSLTELIAAIGDGKE